MNTVARWAMGGLGLSWLVFAAGLAAAEPQVTVEYTPPHLTVKISEATDLHAVLAAVCAETQARCDLAPAAASVAPTTVTGTWGEVVTQLLRGWGLNYTIMPPVEGQAAQLVVLGPSPPATGPAAPALERPRDFASGGTPGSTPETRFDSPEDGSRGSASMPGPQGAPPSGAAASGDQPSTLAGEANRAGADHSEALGRSHAAEPAPATPSAPSGALGTPLWAQIRPPAPRGTTMVLPFPDAQGNPIVVTIPTEPLKVFPFPGPDGQPVPIPPPQPGQKVQWPFPPN